MGARTDERVLVWKRSVVVWKSGLRADPRKRSPVELKEGITVGSANVFTALRYQL